MISLRDAMRLAQSFKRYVKDMMHANHQSSEHNVMMVSEEVSAIIQGGTPIKQPDPGSFVLDCNVQDAPFPRSLCDLGSSVNLMPHLVSISLGYDEFTRTPITLVLAYRSVRVPEGILEDVRVKIDGLHTNRFRCVKIKTRAEKPPHFRETFPCYCRSYHQCQIRANMLKHRRHSNDLL